MSLPILNVLENLGVPQVASEVILLNEPFDWTKTNALIEEIELKLSSEVDLGKRKKIVKVVSNLSLLILTFNVMEIINRLEKPTAITVRK